MLLKTKFNRINFYLLLSKNCLLKKIVESSIILPYRSKDSINKSERGPNYSTTRIVNSRNIASSFDVETARFFPVYFSNLCSRVRNNTRMVLFCVNFSQS